MIKKWVCRTWALGWITVSGKTIELCLEESITVTQHGSGIYSGILQEGDQALIVGTR